MMIGELFAQADLNKARINLKQTQTALAKFQQSTGLTSPSDQTSIGRINELKTTQATVIAQAQANATQAQATAAKSWYKR